MVRTNRKITAGSGNVFADLGLGGAEEKKTKVQLAVTLNRIIQRSGLSQGAAARAMGVNQPKVSALMNYRLEGFSVERLMNFLNALGRDIEIVVRKPRSKREAGIRVTAA
jgi:predicted XRE-type DNA-binding protein